MSEYRFYTCHFDNSIIWPAATSALRHNIVLEHYSRGYYFDTVLKSYTLLFPNRAKNQSCSV
jgi:hypothetical protein